MAVPSSGALELFDINDEFPSPDDPSLSTSAEYIDSRTPGTYSISMSTFYSKYQPYFSTIGVNNGVLQATITGRYYDGNFTNAGGPNGIGRVHVALRLSSTNWTSATRIEVTTSMTWNAAGYWNISQSFTTTASTSYEARIELTECGYLGTSNRNSSAIAFTTGSSGGSGGS